MKRLLLPAPHRGHLWVLPPAVGCLFRHRSMVPPPASCGEERHKCPPCWWHSRAGGGNGVGFAGGHHFHWSREAILSRHDLAAVPMATVRPSATALGIYRHTFSGSRSPVAVCQRAALLIGLPALLTAAQVSYRVLPASVFHGWERPNIGGFRLYTLRRAQPLYKCRHTQWPS